MCIRDRYLSLLVCLSLKKDSRAFQTRPPHASDSVSYTHLDVYKRQVQAVEERRISRILIEKEPLPPEELEEGWEQKADAEDIRGKEKGKAKEKREKREK